MGSGNPEAKLMLIGEAPGFKEDRRGLPFVGDAGQLLDRVLNALGINRDILYITNVLKCRPQNNKLPKGKGAVQACVDACWPYLEEEIQNVDPKVIVLMGGTPLTTLVGLRMITRHEGTEVDTIYDGAKTFAAFHPAYVLRSPSKEANLARAIALAAKAAGINVCPKSIEEIDPYLYEVKV
jgi:DNA polymerase